MAFTLHIDIPKWSREAVVTGYACILSVPTQRFRHILNLPCRSRAIAGIGARCSKSRGSVSAILDLRLMFGLGERVNCWRAFARRRVFLVRRLLPLQPELQLWSICAKRYTPARCRVKAWRRRVI